MERVDSTRLPLDGHMRDRGVGDLHWNSCNRLEATSRGWTKVDWLSSHFSRDAYRRVCVPRQPINRQTNEGSSRRLPRLNSEPRLNGRDAERDEHCNEWNCQRSFDKSHSRKIQPEFGDSATRRNDLGTKKRWM